MVTSKHINKICMAIVAVMLIFTMLILNAKSLGIEVSARGLGYENRLFDRSRVHSLDIVMDDWDELIANATSETYYNCAVVIDGESYKNVAIRGKGNTSLSSVAQMNSERYSFKIEFDQYQKGRSYHGLDKLCLNNIIQDNTYMKDYLAYVMMDEFGVTSPLCSYVYVTVNGEDWGLYLAVEGVEDSFLERNYYGSGELYKPDSMSVGGGRGNGRDFDMKNFMEEMGLTDEDGDGKPDEIPEGEVPEDSDGSSEGGSGSFPGGGMPGGFGGFSGGDSAEGSSDGGFSGFPGGEMPEGGFGGFPGGEMPEGFGGFPGGDSSEGSSENGFSGFPGGEIPEGGFPGGDSTEDSSEEGSEGRKGGFPGGNGGFPGGGKGGFPGGFGMGGDDVKLQYIDDDPDSYNNIFSSAKTDVSEGDKKRLISSLKSLSSYEDLESVLNMDEVLRYFVVHTFTVNGDSYTGTMVHNYYLHEENGELEMIPWDYNLGYGTFQANNASSAVNDAIDTPVDMGDMDSRPMVGWIFSDESYTEMYHEYYRQFVAQFIDSGELLQLIDDTAQMIAPYVEKDPTSFCTYEEFEAGTAAIRTFCELRGQSVAGQLDGTIPSTDEGQNADSSTLVDAGDLNLRDMGSMSNGGGQGGGPGGFPGGGPGKSFNKGSGRDSGRRTGG